MALARQVDKEPSQLWALVSSGSIVASVEALAESDGVATVLAANLLLAFSVNHLMNWAKYHFGKD